MKKKNESFVAALHASCDWWRSEGDIYSGRGLLQEEADQQGQLLRHDPPAHHGNQQLHQHGLAIWRRSNKEIISTHPAGDAQETQPQLGFWIIIKIF